MKLIKKGKRGEGWLSGCTGKVPYFTDGELQHNLRLMKKNNKKGKKYLCDYLMDGKKHYHITSNKKK
jgi:hypothetical protein